MLAHPRYQDAYVSSKHDDISLLSDNSVLISSLRFTDKSRTKVAHLRMNSLSGNTRVKRVYLELGFPVFEEQPFWSLVEWLSWRGDSCDLYLEFADKKYTVGARRSMQRKVSILSSSGAHLNVKELRLGSVFEAAVMDQIFSLVSGNTHVRISGISMRAIITSVLPHIDRTAELGSLYVDPQGSTDTTLAYFYESLLSKQRNVSRLSLLIANIEVLDRVVDSLNEHQAKEGATLNELTLDLSRSLPTRWLASSLERIPARLTVNLSLLPDTDFGSHDEGADEALVQSLRSLAGLRNLQLRNCNKTLSGWVKALKESFRDGLRKFELHALRVSSTCLRSSFYNAKLEVFHLSFMAFTQDLIDVTYAIADLLPTMTRLKDLNVTYFGETSTVTGINTKRDHDEFLEAAMDYSVSSLPLYMAHDALTHAVCDLSPSITSCRVPTLTRWHEDRVAFATKTRLIGLNKLLYTGAPPALFPLALSLLEEGHWYDVMFIIVQAVATCQSSAS